jgi:hypothetical protein
MADCSSVIMYGNSVFLAGLKAKLEQEPGIVLKTVDPGSTDVVEEIQYSKPCALIFDLAERQPDFTIGLLRKLPGLLVIGVNPSSDEVLVFSIHSVQALSVTDLLAVIFRKDSHQVF